MVVCIEPVTGLFFRINSKPIWQTPVKLEKAAHPFLDHDSFLECGDPLDLDDYVITESIKRHGIVGKIITQLANEIFEAVKTAKTISEADRELIEKALAIKPAKKK